MGDRIAALGELSLDDHIAQAQARIRARPQDPALRLVLCQFLALCGQWQRAEDLLKPIPTLGAGFEGVCAACAMALRGERERADFWNGGAAPRLLGETPAWALSLRNAVAIALEAPQAAADMRIDALESAPALYGTLQPEPEVAGDAQAPAPQSFAWLADGDARLGPVLELFTPAGYAWLPMSAVRRIAFEPTQHMMDLLWRGAQIELTAGEHVNALVPVRYPGDLAACDDALRLARRTEWSALEAEDQYAGSGQRTWISDAGDHPMLRVREIGFEGSAA